jgi:hypothetical protein
MATEGSSTVSAGFSTRVRHFLARDTESRRYALRNATQRRLGAMFANFKISGLGFFPACIPDSQWLGRKHPEFKGLYQSFFRGNAANNGGDAARLWGLMLNVKQVLKDNVLGDFAELGVWRGNTAAVLAHYASASARQVYLFDTFEGFDAKDLVNVDADKPMVFANTSEAYVRETLGANDACCRYVKGYFPDSITAECAGRRYAVVSIDCDLYEPMRAGLEFFYPRLSSGGILFLHDYSSGIWNGAAKAIDEFCTEHDEFVILMPDKSGSAFLRKRGR